MKRCQIGKEDYFRQRFALTFHIYPQLDYNNMTMEDFAFWSENAIWLFSQQMMVTQVQGQMSALGALGSGLKK